MTTQIMIDLETMSTSPNAAIIQLGAVAFDLTAPIADTFDPATMFERTVALTSSLLAGGQVDPDTVAWWRRQALEAQAAVTLHGEPLAIVLKEFTAWYDALGKVEGVYAHGAAFDVPVLDSAYRALGLTVPWRYTAVRDTRTLYALATDLAGWQRPRRTTAHTALADAVAQAEDVQSAYQALAVKCVPSVLTFTTVGSGGPVRDSNGHEVSAAPGPGFGGSSS